MNYRWINIGKLIAIIAVIMDHMYMTLYTSNTVQMSFYYSVSVFVILSGITSYYSNERHLENRGLKETARKIGNVFIPYMVAVAVYLVLYDHFLDLKVYIKFLFSFNLSGPFYFVTFFVQLIIISPLLFDSIRFAKNTRIKYLLYALFLVFCIFIAILSMNYTYMFNVHGGGKYLFGGTYLILYYIGMLLAGTALTLKTNKKVLLYTSIVSIIAVLSCLFFIIKDRFSIDEGLPFGTTFNPPNMSLIILSILIVIFVYCFINYLETFDSKIINTIINFLSRLGSYAYYIFLYHLAIVFVLNTTPLIDSHIWMKRIIYMSAMIFIPVIFKIVYDMILKSAKNKINSKTVKRLSG